MGDIKKEFRVSANWTVTEQFVAVVLVSGDEFWMYMKITVLCSMQMLICPC